MGSFYLRKSIKVGPLRFNLSKSGVGVSAGVRGLRVGSGPRGNYVHMGRHGIYYRAALPPSPQGRHLPRPTASDRQPKGAGGQHIGPDHLKEIESGSVTEMVPSSSADLLNELNRKRRRTDLWPFALVAVLLLATVVLAAAPAWTLGVVLVGGAVGVYWVYRRDLLARTAVLFYELDDDLAKAYELLHGWGLQLAASKGTWHIAAAGAVKDRKYHAGASHVVRRAPTTIAKAAPPRLKTNVDTVSIGVGRQTLHFFPDRLLVYDRSGVGAVDYAELELEVREQQFIEEGAVPSDAEVVDRTWRYVNKSGGPDRRFKDNRQLPVCLYEELVVKSASGLNELIQVSRRGVLGGFTKAVRYLGALVRTAAHTEAT